MPFAVVIQFSYTHTMHAIYTHFRIYTRLLILNVVIYRYLIADERIVLLKQLSWHCLVLLRTVYICLRLRLCV